MSTATGQLGERWWEKIHPQTAVVVLFFVLLLALSLQNRVTDPDVWWHLRTGQWIWENKHIPYTDPFSFTMLDQPWIAHSWLSEVWMYLLYHYIGAFTIPLGRSLLQVATMALLFKMMWERWPRLWGNLLLLAMVFLASTKFWLYRPNSVSLSLLIVVLYVWYRYKWHRRDALWLLPLLMALWVNLHAGYIQGLLLLGVLFVGEIPAGRLWPDPVPLERTRWLRFGLFALLSVPAVLVNPYGPRLLIYPFTYYIGGTSTLTDYIGEWVSPNFKEPSNLLFAVLLLGFIAALAWRRTGAGPAETLAVFVFSGMALSSIRVIGFAAPLLAWSAAGVLGQGAALRPGPARRGAWPRPARAKAWAWCGGLALLVALLLAAIGFEYVAWGRQSGFVEEGIYPRQATAALARLPSSTRILNTYNWGGYLIWQLYPDHLVFIDGRSDLYAASILEDYLQMHKAGSAWAEVLDRYRVDVVICQRNEPMAALLSASSSWQLLHLDEMAALFQRTP